jgi:hypothetical protein
MSLIEKLTNKQIHEIAEKIAIVHDSMYREAWFAFKQQVLEEYVRNIIRHSTF